MKFLAAYLLLTLGGNSSPKAADIKSLLESVGVESDEERLNKVISELEGKDINQVCIEGDFVELLGDIELTIVLVSS